MIRWTSVTRCYYHSARCTALHLKCIKTLLELLLSSSYQLTDSTDINQLRTEIYKSQIFTRTQQDWRQLEQTFRFVKHKSQRWNIVFELSMQIDKLWHKQCLIKDISQMLILLAMGQMSDYTVPNSSFKNTQINDARIGQFRGINS